MFAAWFSRRLVAMRRYHGLGTGIDTLRRATPGKSENDPKDMSVFLANADALAQHFGCFVGVAHHSPRSDDKRGSGTNAIEGACDVILPVTRCDHGDVPPPS
jgi:AAA domain